MDIARPSRKKEIQRKRIMLGVAAVLALSAFTWFINSLEPAAREVERSSIYYDEVKRGEMLRSVRGPGTLVPEKIRWIAAETEGRVEEIIIDPGAEVNQGDVILELSNPEVEQSAEEAQLQLLAVEAEYEDLRVSLDSQLLDQRAEMARLKADLESAVLDAEAYQELFDSGIVPEIQLKQRKLVADQFQTRFGFEEERLQKTEESIAAQLSAKRTEVNQQRALYQLRENQLKSLQVRASLDGVLQQVPVEEGQRVAPGANLARVAQPDVLKAELRIAETQAKDIRIGQVANVDTRNGIAQGKVTRIDPAVEAGTVTVDVSLTELPPGARPDLSVDGTIELERLEDVLYIPRPAYGQPMSTVGLFKIAGDGTTATRVPVQLGKTSVQTMEVIDGLVEGDQVILSDTSQWDDSDRIRLR